MDQSVITRLSKYMGYVVAFILVILPFHEFLTTWLASNFGHLDAFRIWKEIVIFVLIFGCLFILFKTPKLKSWFFKDNLVKLILIFALLNIVIAVWAKATHKVNNFALVDGLLIDLRFLAFFLVAVVISYHTKFLKKFWQALLIIPSTIVVIFGLLQLLLPINFLSHFGYGAKTIPAYATVDQKLKYHRIQSTLRGANPLGAYLVLTIPALFINLKKNKVLKLILAVLSLIALFFTYSRSAYVGLFLTLLIFYYFLYLNKKYQKQFFIIIGILLILGGLLVVGLRFNKTAENVFFHTDSTSKSKQSSNSQRLTNLKAGVKDVIHQPLGGGPGTAGPASVHNNHPARISENYYVQVAQESGVIGLILFLSINAVVIYRLYLNKKDPLAILLFASFVGISFINLISHAWADDTLSLLWWGFAGIMLTPAILKRE